MEQIGLARLGEEQITWKGNHPYVSFFKMLWYFHECESKLFFRTSLHAQAKPQMEQSIYFCGNVEFPVK